MTMQPNFDLASVLAGAVPGNWTGNTVNIPGLPSAHIGTDPLPVPSWQTVRPSSPSMPYFYPGLSGQQIGGGAGSSSVGGSGYMGAGGADQVGVAPSNDTYTPAGPFGDAQFALGSLGGGYVNGYSGGSPAWYSGGDSGVQPSNLSNFDAGGLLSFLGFGNSSGDSGNSDPFRVSDNIARDSSYVVPNTSGASTSDYINAALNALGLVPGLGAASAANNAVRGISSGFDRASYGDVQGPNPTIAGSQVLGNYAYGKGLLGTITDGLGWLLGQGANALGITPGGVAPSTAGPLDAIVPTNFSGPSNAQYSGVYNTPAFQSFATAYSGNPNNTTNPGGFDINSAIANRNPANYHIPSDVLAQLSQTPTIDTTSQNPFSLTGNMMDSFMQGAGFGGAGYGYGGVNPYDYTGSGGWGGGQLPPNWTT